MLGQGIWRDIRHAEYRREEERRAVGSGSVSARVRLAVKEVWRLEGEIELKGRNREASGGRVCVWISANVRQGVGSDVDCSRT